MSSAQVVPAQQFGTAVPHSVCAWAVGGEVLISNTVMNEYGVIGYCAVSVYGYGLGSWPAMHACNACVPHHYWRTGYSASGLLAPHLKDMSEKAH
jgi:hypothetical protein